MGCVYEVHFGGLSDQLDVGEDTEGIARNEASCLVPTAKLAVGLHQEGAVERGQIGSVMDVWALQCL